jgi:hypothetical protein
MQKEMEGRQQFESFHDERRRFPSAVEEYREKPPLLTSDSTAQMAEKTFCGKD